MNYGLLGPLNSSVFDDSRIGGSFKAKSLFKERFLGVGTPGATLDCLMSFFLPQLSKRFAIEGS